MTDTADKECKVGKIFRTVSMAMGQFPGSKHFQVSGFSLQIQPCFRKDGYSYDFSRLQKRLVQSQGYSISRNRCQLVLTVESNDTQEVRSDHLYRHQKCSEKMEVHTGLVKHSMLCVLSNKYRCYPGWS